MAPEHPESRTEPELFKALLGPDLWGLTEDVGTPLLAAVPATTLPSVAAFRAAFRLTFSDGTVLKGRRVNSPDDAVRIEALSALLDTRHFPRILARRGRALLEPWRPGEPLRLDDRTTALFRACGSLQAALHRIPLPQTVGHLRRRPANWELRFDRLLADLVASGALDPGAGREIARLAVLHAPGTSSVGLCHTDFCAENIITDAVGAIFVIDNEDICVDACEYDLARTWYRWPMTELQQRAYAEGYGHHEHVDRFADHFLHWALMTLVESSAFRVRTRVPGASIPLERLAELLRSHGRGERFPRLLRGG
jgi:hypothetical protein